MSLPQVSPVAHTAPGSLGGAASTAGGSGSSADAFRSSDDKGGTGGQGVSPGCCDAPGNCGSCKSVLKIRDDALKVLEKSLDGLSPGERATRLEQINKLRAINPTGDGVPTESSDQGDFLQQLNNVLQALPKDVFVEMVAKLALEGKDIKMFKADYNLSEAVVEKVFSISGKDFGAIKEQMRSSQSPLVKGLLQSMEKGEPVSISKVLNSEPFLYFEEKGLLDHKVNGKNFLDVLVDKLKLTIPDGGTALDALLNAPKEILDKVYSKAMSIKGVRDFVPPKELRSKNSESIALNKALKHIDLQDLAMTSNGIRDVNGATYKSEQVSQKVQSGAPIQTIANDLSQLEPAVRADVLSQLVQDDPGTVSQLVKADPNLMNDLSSSSKEIFALKSPESGAGNFFTPLEASDIVVGGNRFSQFLGRNAPPTEAISFSDRVGLISQMPSELSASSLLTVSQQPDLQIPQPIVMSSMGTDAVMSMSFLPVLGDGLASVLSDLNQSQGQQILSPSQEVASVLTELVSQPVGDGRVSSILTQMMAQDPVKTEMLLKDIVVNNIISNSQTDTTQLTQQLQQVLDHLAVSLKDPVLVQKGVFELSASVVNHVRDEIQQFVPKEIASDLHIEGSPLLNGSSGSAPLKDTQIQMIRTFVASMVSKSEQTQQASEGIKALMGTSFVTTERLPSIAKEVVAQVATSSPDMLPSIAKEVFAQVVASSPEFLPLVAKEVVAQVVTSSPDMLPAVVKEVVAQVATSSPDMLPLVAKEVFAQVATSSPDMLPAVAKEVVAQVATSIPDMLPAVAKEVVAQVAISSPDMLPAVAKEVLAQVATSSPALLPSVAKEVLAQVATSSPELLPSVAKEVLAQVATSSPELLPVLAKEVASQLSQSNPTALPVLAQTSMFAVSQLKPSVQIEVGFSLVQSAPPSQMGPTVAAVLSPLASSSQSFTSMVNQLSALKFPPSWGPFVVSLGEQPLTKSVLMSHLETAFQPLLKGLNAESAAAFKGALSQLSVSDGMTLLLSVKTLDAAVVTKFMDQLSRLDAKQLQVATSILTSLSKEGVPALQNFMIAVSEISPKQLQQFLTLLSSFTPKELTNFMSFLAVFSQNLGSENVKLLLTMKPEALKVMIQSLNDLDSAQLNALLQGLEAMSPESAKVVMQALSGMKADQIAALMKGLNLMNPEQIATFMQGLSELNIEQLQIVMKGLVVLSAEQLSGMMKGLSGMSSESIGIFMKGLQTFSLESLTTFMNGLKDMSPKHLEALFQSMGSMTPQDLQSFMITLAGLKPGDLASIMASLSRIDSQYLSVVIQFIQQSGLKGPQLAAVLNDLSTLLASQDLQQMSKEQLMALLTELPGLKGNQALLQSLLELLAQEIGANKKGLVEAQIAHLGDASKMMDESAVALLSGAQASTEEQKKKQAKSWVSTMLRSTNLRGMVVASDSMTRAFGLMFGHVFDASQLTETTGGLGDWLEYLDKKRKEKEEREEEERKRNAKTHLWLNEEEDTQEALVKQPELVSH